MFRIVIAHERKLLPIRRKGNVGIHVGCELLRQYPPNSGARYKNFSSGLPGSLRTK